MKKIFIFYLIGITSLIAQPNTPVIIITENFDSDPKWEGVNNRVECSNCPTVTQKFGWTPTNKTGFGPGEIGGVIWKSTTPAFYAMPIGQPLNFKNHFSASGKIAVIDPQKNGAGFYIGFFNAERQGWRVWSSCGFRIGEMKNGVGRFFIDYKTGDASGANLFPDIEIKGDGSVNSWKLEYDPNACVSDNPWPDHRLPKYFQNKQDNVTTQEILNQFVKDEPTMTFEKLEKLLLKSRDLGLVDDWYRKGLWHLWTLEKNPENIKGKITFTFNDKSVSYYLLPGHQDVPTFMNRFGVYNWQMYTGSMEFYLSDLEINGKKIDLSHDPYWQGLNNSITFVEKDFHSRHNFGFTQTNWAGTEPGEIGGRFWGTEVIDPLHGYYAADIGDFTLEDSIKFSGKICFPEGSVDGRMLIGYFNKELLMTPIEGEYKGNPPNNFIGIEIMDLTRNGYNVALVVSPRQEISEEKRGPIIIPDRISRLFTFEYNPAAGKFGRVTIHFDNEIVSYDLKEKQRKTGSKFNRFGLVNPRKGGKYVDIYFDDLSFFSRKSKNEMQKFDQKIIIEPYPEGGRKYY